MILANIGAGIRLSMTRGAVVEVHVAIMCILLSIRTALATQSHTYSRSDFAA